MNERYATLSGYLLFCALAVLVGRAAIYISTEHATVEVEETDPVTIQAGIDSAKEPTLLYIAADLKNGYSVGTLDDPTPLRTVIQVDSCPYKLIGSWKSVTSSSGVMWYTEISGYDAEAPLKVSGSIRVTLQNKTQCRVPEWFEFSTQ